MKNWDATTITRPMSNEVSGLLAHAYLRLLAQATNQPTTYDVLRPEDSSEKSREPLDFGSGIAMTCTGQDNGNPLAGKDLKDGK